MEKNNILEEQQKKHIQKVYKEKALNLISYANILLIIDLITYILGIIFFKSFDFGILLEILTFIFLLISKNMINSSDPNSKIALIISVIPIAWLFIYDCIEFLFNFSYYTLEFLLANSIFQIEFFIELIMLAIIVLIMRAYASICKSNGDNRFNHKNDIFYDKL